MVYIAMGLPLKILQLVQKAVTTGSDGRSLIWRYLKLFDMCKNVQLFPCV